jgi:parallel beta-helix repeat protein
MIQRILLHLAAIAALLPAGCSSNSPLRPGADAAKRLQEALIGVKPGATIELSEGKFELDRPISLTVAKVRLKGAGLDKTILSFAGQKAGSAGLSVTAGDFVIEDLTIQDTKGDALKINGVANVTIRRIKTEWTGGPKESNGAYGIYPVQCTDVLIEDSIAIGASDAGIYVGQSRNIVVRRNRAEYNVAGIEIENSTQADVYGNVATKNTGGMGSPISGRR